jgi:RsiW-degrading membrane proteinase PrsW (M82 family)
MALVVAFTHVWAALQVFLLGTVGRTVRWRAVVLAFLTGAYGCTALTGLVQFAWILGASALLDRRVADVIAFGSWTIDPAIEELLKVAPLVLLMGLAPRLRRDLRTVDLVVLGAALGAGFGLTETLLGLWDWLGRGIWSTATGHWLLPIGINTVEVPAPLVALRAWIPDGTVDSVIWALDTPAVTPNLHLAWSSLCGLAAGLALRPGPRVQRWLAVLPLLVAVADHTAFNYAATSLASPDAAAALSRAPVRYLYPLVALAVALWADRREGLPGPRWGVPPRPSWPGRRPTAGVLLGVLMLVPALVALGPGTWPGMDGLRQALVSPAAFWTQLALLVLGMGWAARNAARGLRVLPLVLRRGGTELVTLQVLALVTAAGGLVFGTVALGSALTGRRAADPLLAGAHLADGWWAVLLAAAIAIAFTAVIAGAISAGLLVGTAAVLGRIAVAGVAATAAGVALTEANQGDLSIGGDGGTSGAEQGGELPAVEGVTAEDIYKNPDLVRGWTKEDVERILGELPDNWVREPVNKGEGEKWGERKVRVDPRTGEPTGELGSRTGRTITIERQPQVDDPTHKGWYIKVTGSGATQRIPLAGNPALGGS